MDDGYLGVENFTVQLIADIITGFACWLIGIVLAVMVTFLVVAGIRYFLARGNETKVADATKNLTWTLVGILVILATNVIIATVANALGRDYSFIPLNCSFAPPTPGSVVCTPKSQSAKQGQTVNLSASGGDGSYSWDAPGGSPQKSTSSKFSVAYSTSGTKTITVTSAGKSSSCTVNVSSSEVELPIILSFTPKTTTAGTKSNFNQETGVVSYTYLDVSFEMKGQRLKNAVITSNNIGVDGKAGVEFKNLKISDTSITGTMLMHSTAKDETTIITITTPGGSAKTEINVKITGTQYLQRRFKDKNVKFFGDWPNLMPDEIVLKLESLINKGSQEIDKPNYKKLGVVSHIYEEGFFIKKRVCPSGEKVLGCASRADNIIKIRGTTDTTLEFLGVGVPSTILHETAHKFHFYNNGWYRPLPSSKTNFEKEWKDTLGNLGLCPFLPITKDNLWADGGDGPKCGFVRAYGAYLVEKGDVFEDVATFEQAAHFGFPPGLPNDPRYNQKSGLLKNYGF